MSVAQMNKRAWQELEREQQEKLDAWWRAMDRQFDEKPLKTGETIKFRLPDRWFLR